MRISSEQTFFTPDLQREIKARFEFVDTDCRGQKRLFFENSGGSLRLTAAIEAKAKYERIPDCPERYHDVSMGLKDIKANGIRDILEVVFGAAPGHGALVTELTASQCMFQIVRTIMENAPAGGNAVVTSLEHPSAYDSVEQYCGRTGREFRVAVANPATGGVDEDEILRHVDAKTVLLSVMSASNITGYQFDMASIAAKARTVNPDIFIVSDAVQHMPHGLLDVAGWGLDGCTFAPYKAFGIRGCGFGYVSDRVAAMYHHKLSAKPTCEWELGTFPHPNFAAFSAVVDYVCWLGSHFTDAKDRKALFAEGMRRIHLQEHSLLLHMLEGTPTVPGLRHIPGVHVHADGPDDADRDLISAVSIDGISAKDAVVEFYKRGATVFNRSNDSLYSKRIVESIGQTDVLRVSPLHCHDCGDIENFLRITAEIARAFS